jgi:hypothetical protein
MSLLRGFDFEGYDGVFRERMWVADFANGVSFTSRVGGVWTKSLANKPDGKSVQGVMLQSKRSSTANVFVSTETGVYALDQTTLNCKVTTSTACTWLNQFAGSPKPVLTPSGAGTARTAAFAGLARVPSSADTLVVPRPFTAGNFIAVRVGDGAAGLSSAASSADVFLEEYTPVGVRVQTMKLSSNFIPSSVPFKLAGTGVTLEGIPSSSPNGYFISLAAFANTQKSAVIARIINSGGVDYSTMMTPAGSNLGGVAGSAVSNSGDSVWVCTTHNILGNRLSSAFVGFAGTSTSDLSTYAAAGSTCRSATFSCQGCGSANTLWLGNATTISSASVSSPTTLSTVTFRPVSGLTGVFNSLRQFVFQSETQIWAADYNVGVWPFSLSDGIWSPGTLLTPSGGDLAVFGVTLVSRSEPSGAKQYLYISSTTKLFCVDVTDPLTPSPVNGFAAIVAARSNIEFRGLVAAPVPPPGALIVYSASTTFTAGNMLALRAESGVSSTVTSRLFVDEINPATSTVMQSWLLPSSNVGARVTLPGGAGSLGQLTITADGKYVMIPGTDTAAGTTIATGASYGHIVARLSCRGSVTFTNSFMRTDTWYGAAAAAGDEAIYVASSVGLLSIDASGQTLTTVSTACASGFASVSVIAPYSEPTTYALSRGCGMFLASGTPLSGFAQDNLTTTLSSPDAAAAFSPVTANASISSDAEYFYVASGGTLIRNALYSGGIAASRGFVAPSATEPITGVYSSAGLVSGLLVATSASIYRCASLACGPGVSSFNISSALMFRTTAGKQYANSLSCTINVNIPSNFFAGVRFLSFKTSGPDYLSASDVSGFIVPPSTGSTLPTAALSSKNSFSMLFVTNDNIVSDGAVGQITAVPFTCGSSRVFDMAATALEWPLGSNSTFRTNAIGAVSQIKKRCDFLVNVASGRSVTLTISQYSVTSNALFTIYEGSNSQGFILGRYTSTQPAAVNTKLQTRGVNSMYVTYVSDDTLTANGIVGLFNFSVYTAPVYTNNILDPGNGNTVVITEDGARYSSRTGTTYQTSKAYVARFSAPNGYVVNMTLLGAALETNWDYVWFLDGATLDSALIKTGWNAVTKQKSCPQAINQQTHAFRYSWCLSSGQDLMIRMVSDSSVVFEGVTAVGDFVYKMTSLEDPMLCVSGIASTIGGNAGGWVAGVKHYVSTTNAQGMNCTVSFNAPTGYMVKITVVSWSVSVSDRFSVTDGPTMLAPMRYPLIIPATSIQPSGAIYSSGNTITLNYVTGLAPSDGVTLYAEPVQLSSEFPSSVMCTRLVSSTSRALSAGQSVIVTTSPSHIYGNLVGCGLTISAPAGDIMSLFFQTFVIESGRDFFAVFDGKNSQYPLLANLSGSVLPANVSTTQEFMHIMFTTDAANVYAGVRALATATVATAFSCAAGVSTTRVVTGVAGSLRTQAGASFSAGVSCSFRVIAPSGYAVYLSYSTFALAGGVGSWSVYDGASAAAPALTLAASGAVAPSPASSSGNTLFVTFTSTGSAAGVVARINFIPASSCARVASAGSGSSYMGLAAAPSGCGWNDRRLEGPDADADARQQQPPTQPQLWKHSQGDGRDGHIGPPPVTHPCHVNTDRDACLVPTRAIEVSK